MLPDVITALEENQVRDKIWVGVDGGVRRGTDIFKAIALGANAVGIGRPALYSMAAYGQPGIERMLCLLKKELEMTLRLTGATSSLNHVLSGCQSIADIKRTMVDARNLHDHIAMVPADSLYNGVYVPPGLPEYGAAVAAAVRAEAASEPSIVTSFVCLLVSILQSVFQTVCFPMAV